MADVQNIRKEFEKVVKRQKMLNKKTNETLESLIKDLDSARHRLQAGTLASSTQPPPQRQYS